MGSDEKQRKAYRFLLRHAESQKTFTPQELGSETGWTGKTPATNLAKQFKSVVESPSRGHYRVKRHFIHLAEEDFIKRTSQKEKILPSYTRTSYDSVLLYEFLMPLTREDLLRQGLDRLFFKDTLERQLTLLGTDAFESVIPRGKTISDEAYIGKVADKVAEYFGGYSILHASGRFRADDLMTQQDAVGKRYIIDETTAIVRFIIPLKASARSHRHIFDPAVENPTNQDENLTAEVKLVRTLFFTVFAEVVVHSVQGEDEIWLIEGLNGSQRLYKWETKDQD